MPFTNFAEPETLRDGKKQNAWFAFDDDSGTQSALPSRIIDELPEEHVEVAPMTTSYGGHSLGFFGTSRFDDGKAFGQGSYSTPGRKSAAGTSARHTPRFIEGTLAVDATAVLDCDVSVRE